jgi:hypothetical protein
MTQDDIASHGIPLCAIADDLCRRYHWLSCRPNYIRPVMSVGLPVPAFAVGFLDERLANNYHEVATISLVLFEEETLHLSVTLPAVLETYRELRGHDAFYGTRQYQRFERFQLADPDSLDQLDQSIRLVYQAWQITRKTK